MGPQTGWFCAIRDPHLAQKKTSAKMDLAVKSIQIMILGMTKPALERPAVALQICKNTKDPFLKTLYKITIFRCNYNPPEPSSTTSLPTSLPTLLPISFPTSLATSLTFPFLWNSLQFVEVLLEIVLCLGLVKFCHLCRYTIHTFFTLPLTLLNILFE